jgi:hypothetical protein
MCAVPVRPRSRVCKGVDTPNPEIRYETVCPDALLRKSQFRGDLGWQLNRIGGYYRGPAAPVGPVPVAPVGPFPFAPIAPVPAAPVGPLPIGPVAAVPVPIGPVAPVAPTIPAYVIGPTGPGSGASCSPSGSASCESGNCTSIGPTGNLNTRAPASRAVPP